MRGAIMGYYLKILLAICAIHELTGGVIRSTTDAAYKKYLALKSLPFEDCGECLQSTYPQHRSFDWDFLHPSKMIFIRLYIFMIAPSLTIYDSDCSMIAPQKRFKFKIL